MPMNDGEQTAVLAATAVILAGTLIAIVVQYLRRRDR